MNHKRFAINMIAQVIAFVISLGISFFLSPYIINNIGSEAYGFFNLANTFVSYAQVVTVALNSMASRFITIHIQRKEVESTNRYFSSVVISNIILSVVLTFIFSIIILNLEKILIVPETILFDVKLLWFFVFVSFIVSVLTSTYAVATFSKDRLDLTNLRSIEANLIRTAILMLLFWFLKPSVWYLGLSTLVMNMYIAVWNMYYTKKLLPEVMVKKEFFDFSKIKELISAGIWNSFSRVSSILSSGLDLVITNLFVGPTAMGVVSVAKTIPNVILTFFGQIAGVFMPQLTLAYADNDKEKMKEQLFFSIKVLGIISSIPMAILIVYGSEFYQLWVPTQNANLLQQLSIVSCLAYIFALPLEGIWNVFTITNNVKKSSIFLFVCSVLTLIIVFIGVNVFTSDTAKMFIVMGTSTMFSLFRALTFLPMYGAKCLGLDIFTFYPAILKNTFSVIIVTIIAFLIERIIPIHSWFTIILDCILLGIVAIVFNYFIILNKRDRDDLFSVLKRRKG